VERIPETGENKHWRELWPLSLEEIAVCRAERYEYCDTELRQEILNKLEKRKILVSQNHVSEHTASRWETPEQYKARTGKPWPDDWAVYYRYVSASGKLDIWRTGYYENIANSNHDFRSHNAGYYQIVCATEAGPPPDDWRPEDIEREYICTRSKECPEKVPEQTWKQGLLFEEAWDEKYSYCGG
jgi:hypothetical protein